MKIKVYYSDKLCLIFQKRSPRTLLTNSANSAKEITINKKSADQLHINTPQEKLDFILQSSTEYALIGAYTDGQIFLWNEGAQCIYGHPPEEAVGKANISLLFTKDDLTKLNEVIDIILRGNKWEGTLTQQRKNGEKFSFPEPILTPEKYVGCEQAIADLPSLENDLGKDRMEYPSTPLSKYQEYMRKNSSILLNHVGTVHTELVKSVISVFVF